MRRLRITRLDWYIIRKFIGTYFFAILLIISISVVFDIAEKIDDFSARGAPLQAIVFDYYLNFIPYFANLFSSLFVFISVIFITSKMAIRSEIIAILSSGVSFRRLLYPYMLSAGAIFGLSFTLSNFVIPPANRTRIDFEHSYVRWIKYKDQRDIHKQVRPGLFVYMRTYNPYAQEGYQLSIEQFEGRMLRSKLWCDIAKWNDSLSKWKLGPYYVRHYTDTGEWITRGDSVDTVFYLEPKDLARTNLDVETMSYFELNRYIQEQLLQGASDVNHCYVEKYGRTATPFAAFILTLIGVSVSSRKTRGGMGMHLGIGLGLSFTYILFMRFSTMFAIGGTLPPLIAVWLPNMLFGVIALFIYRRAPK